MCVCSNVCVIFVNKTAPCQCGQSTAIFSTIAPAAFTCVQVLCMSTSQRRVKQYERKTTLRSIAMNQLNKGKEGYLSLECALYLVNKWSGTYTSNSLLGDHMWNCMQSRKIPTRTVCVCVCAVWEEWDMGHCWRTVSKWQLINLVMHFIEIVSMHALWSSDRRMKEARTNKHTHTHETSNRKQAMAEWEKHWKGHIWGEREKSNGMAKMS